MAYGEPSGRGYSLSGAYRLSGPGGGTFGTKKEAMKAAIEDAATYQRDIQVWRYNRSERLEVVATVWYGGEAQGA